MWLILAEMQEKILDFISKESEQQEPVAISNDQETA